MTDPRLSEALDLITAANGLAGKLKKAAATLGKDQSLADALWATGGDEARRVAVLLMEKTALTKAYIESLAADLATMDSDARSRISEWLLANQLLKHKTTAPLVDTWTHHPQPILRRLYWYCQARKRWTGKVVDGSAELLTAIEAGLADEHEDVQWTMNFTAGWIGVNEPDLRERCVALGERLGLYAGEKVPKNCTPNYLPEFIRIEVAKRA